jgi:hypothetical protein
VHDFETFVKQGRRLRAAGDLTAALRELEKAEQLRSAPFLEDDLYENGINARRRELEEQFEWVSEALGDIYLERGQAEEAAVRYRGVEHPSEKVFAKLCRCNEVIGDKMGARRDLEMYRLRVLGCL